MNKSTVEQEEKSDEEEKREMLNYFHWALFQALGSYTCWKTVVGSRQRGLISEESAKGYVKIQNPYKGFFTSTEKAFYSHFMLLLCHFFDNDQRGISHSFRNMKGEDEEKVNQFREENKETLNFMYERRNKLFAHKDRELPKGSHSVKEIFELFDPFFKNLIKLYKEIDRKGTSFSNAEVVKNDIEEIFEAIYHYANPSIKNEISAQQWNKRDKVSESFSCIE